MSPPTESDARALLDAARAAREQAYAPYSRFRVGAALLCADGTIVPGCNVENASYGLSMCAERVALGNARVAGHGPFVAVAIATGAQSTPPCGACRQVLAELAPGIEVILPATSEGEPVQRFTIEDLLPHHFGAADLAPGQDPQSS